MALRDELMSVTVLTLVHSRCYRDGSVVGHSTDCSVFPNIN